MSRTRVKCNGARARGRAKCNQYAQNLSRTTRPVEQRFIPMPPIAGAVVDADVFITSTCIVEDPEPAPARYSMKERAAAAIAKLVEQAACVEDWSVGVHPLAFHRPEELTAIDLEPEALCIYGRLNGSGVFRSSPIVKVVTAGGAVVVYTFKGSRYRLGKPNPEFQQWCQENNFKQPTTSHYWP